MARSRDAGYVSAFEVGVAYTEIKDESYKSHSVSRMRTRDRGYVSGTTIAGFIDESFDSIATTNITTNTASVTFSSIPANYKHLQVRCIVRDDSLFAERALFVEINGNSPSGSNAYHILSGNGSSASSSAATSQGRWSDTISVPAASATANIFGAVIIDVLDYANTNKTKTLRALGGYDANGTGKVVFSSYLYNSTNAISSLVLYTNQNVISGSSFALYGIKG